MAIILTPRLDAASKLAPNTIQAGHADNFAKAEGLTESEASQLVAWLQEAGYRSIELVQESSQCSVQWIKT